MMIKNRRQFKKHDQLRPGLVPHIPTSSVFFELPFLFANEDMKYE